MENNKNPPSVFPSYVIGDAKPQGHNYYQNMVVLKSFIMNYNLGQTLKPQYNQNLIVIAVINANCCQKGGQQPSKLGKKCLQ